MPPTGRDLKGRFPVTRAEKWRAPLKKMLKFFGRFDSLLTANLFSASLCLHEKDGSCISKQPLLSRTHHPGSFSHQADDVGVASVTAAPHRALSFCQLPFVKAQVFFFSFLIASFHSCPSPPPHHDSKVI